MLHRGWLGSKKLTSEGKIPHNEELEKHPEKSMEGRMWLMGDVSAMINVRLSFHIGWFYNTGTKTDIQDVKPAKEIVDDMVKEAKQCLERGSKVLSGGARAKL
jgi:hypothetical protein